MSGHDFMLNHGNRVIGCFFEHDFLVSSIDQGLENKIGQGSFDRDVYNNGRISFAMAALRLAGEGFAVDNL